MTPRSAWSLTKNFELSETFSKKLASELKDISESGNSQFLNALLPVLWIAKPFGVLPLSIKNKTIRFKWVSLPFAYWLFITSMQVSYTGLRICSVFILGKNEDTWIGIIQNCSFYVLGVSGNIFLLRSALKLPHLMQSYSKMEKKFAMETLPNFKRKILVLMIVLMTSAAGETIASMFYRVYSQKHDEGGRFLKVYIKLGHERVGKILGHSDFIGILLILINKFATFVWNYLDLLISVVAITLTSIMEGFNARVRMACSSHLNPVNWVSLKRLHMDVYRLNVEVNDVFGYLVLQSYATNLFFILLQVYNGLRNLMSSNNISEDYGIIDSCYLAWSFMHLMGRLLVVTLCCSKFHHTSLEPLPNLLAVENSRYSSDLKNLIHQVETLTFGLNGVGFFLVNKSFFVTVGGALLTYEVILLQLSPTTISKKDV